MKDSKPRPGRAVPRSRTARLANLGGLASRVAGNVLLEGSKQLASGQKPKLSELVLTPGNLKHLADKLAKMRGAAMKVGQLLSMDAGAVLPEELASILERLRDDAATMPAAQLVAMLKANWGDNWHTQFSHFSFQPIAAASIGQVHEATHKDGRHLAIKVQYPGVRDSIDSDVNNVVGLLRLSGLLPKSLGIEPLVEEATRQLHAEADYLHEGRQLGAYTENLQSFSFRQQFIVPSWHEDLSTRDILCMDFCQGTALDALRHQGEVRNEVMQWLFALFVSEFFQHRLVQTDPNLGNYAYQAASHQLILYDFGAVRHFPEPFVQSYLNALQCAIEQRRDDLHQALSHLGFFSNEIDDAHRQVVVDIFILAAEPFRHEGPYPFGTANLTQRIHEKGLSLGTDPSAWHTPPADVLFLHRKMAGLYLLAAKLRASVDVGRLFRDVL